jgi:hypothetical protein
MPQRKEMKHYEPRNTKINPKPKSVSRIERIASSSEELSGTRN